MRGQIRYPMAWARGVQSVGLLPAHSAGLDEAFGLFQLRKHIPQDHQPFPVVVGLLRGLVLGKLGGLMVHHVELGEQLTEQGRVHRLAEAAADDLPVVGLEPVELLEIPAELGVPSGWAAGRC